MFKVGDKVRCLTPTGELESGKIYNVKELTENKHDLGLKLEETAMFYHAFRFELVDDFDPNGASYSFPDKTGKGVISGIMPLSNSILLKVPSRIGTSKNDKKPLTLPTDSAERKNYPMLSGCLNYFPAALAGVSHISKIGNDKHNPGEPLHHARGKSTDHGDCIIRHLTDTENLLAALKRDGNVTSEMILTEANCLAWRALAYTQELHEKFGAPLAPGAKEFNPKPEINFEVP